MLGLPPRPPRLVTKVLVPGSRELAQADDAEFVSAKPAFDVARSDDDKADPTAVGSAEPVPIVGHYLNEDAEDQTSGALEYLEKSKGKLRSIAKRSMDKTEKALPCRMLLLWVFGPGY